MRIRTMTHLHAGLSHDSRAGPALLGGLPSLSEALLADRRAEVARG
jgi:hypothetical protein